MFHVPAHKHVGPNGPGQIVNPIPVPEHQVKAPVDFYFSNEGSICLLEPASVAGHEWLAENVPEGALFWGASLVVEPRYVRDILQGIVNDGLEVV